MHKYARLEGLSYRIVPVDNQNNVELDISFKNMTEKFGYGNANKQGVYFDEENRRHINSLRQSHAMVALNLVDANKKDSAVKILNKYDNSVLEENCPYGMTSNRGNFHNRFSQTFLYAAYRAGDMNLAKKVHQSLKSDLDQQMAYYQSLGDGVLNNDQLYAAAAQTLNGRAGGLSTEQEKFAGDIASVYQMLQQLNAWEKEFNPKTVSPTENAPSTLPAPDSASPDTTNK